MPEDPAPKPKFTRDPQALTSEYHKARKQLMLWAGILFIWELVGIDLDKAKEAGGNAGAVVGAIKAPQAVPWAFLTLILYFGFKLRIEWGQCNHLRRQMRESRVDYYSAFFVASIAFILYLAQAISHIQFANAVQGSSRFESFFAGIVLCTSVGIIIRLVTRWHPPDMNRRVAIVVIIVGLVSALELWNRSRFLQWMLYGLLLGSVVTGFIFAAERRVKCERNQEAQG